MKKLKIESILQNKENAKEYDEEHLLNMTDWSNDYSFDTIGEFKVDDFIYKNNSSWEKSVILHLKRTGYAKIIRGQNLIINYRNKKQKSAKSKYQPDIVLLNKDNHIVIIEIKPLVNMITDENRRKMLYLASYCHENRYLYCMCDNYYRDITYLNDVKVPQYFLKSFFTILYKNKRFIYDDIDKIKELHPSLNKKKINLYIAACIYQYDLKAVKGDLTNKIKHILIRLKKTSKVYADK